MPPKKTRQDFDIRTDIEQLRSALSSTELCLTKFNASLRGRVIRLLDGTQEQAIAIRGVLDKLAVLQGQFVTIRSQIDFLMGVAEMDTERNAQTKSKDGA